ncbi:MAG: hypothetical protein Q7T82_07700 [Armatimonadota bacterium]|nr:hypothetical protein [Armatimonadota bacterium]
MGRYAGQGKFYLVARSAIARRKLRLSPTADSVLLPRRVFCLSWRDRRTKKEDDGKATSVKLPSYKFVLHALLVALWLAVGARNAANCQAGAAVSSSKDSDSAGKARRFASEYLHEIGTLPVAELAVWSDASATLVSGAGHRAKGPDGLELRVLVAGRDAGYVVTAGGTGRPYIREFAAVGSPVSTTFPATGSIVTPFAAADDARAVVRDIPNVPNLTPRNPDQAALADILAFWAGRRATLLALRETRLTARKTGSRANMLAWYESAMGQFSRSAGVALSTTLLSGACGERSHKPSFTDYRIEIDQGRPPIVILNRPDDDSPLVCVGVGYVTSRFGDFVHIVVEEGVGKPAAGQPPAKPRRVYLNWESLAQYIDILTVAGERGRRTQ